MDKKEEITQIINQVSNRTITTDEAIEEILALSQLKEVEKERGITITHVNKEVEPKKEGYIKIKLSIKEEVANVSFTSDGLNNYEILGLLRDSEITVLSKINKAKINKNR